MGARSERTETVKRSVNAIHVTHYITNGKSWQTKVSVALQGTAKEAHTEEWLLDEKQWWQRAIERILSVVISGCFGLTLVMD